MVGVIGKAIKGFGKALKSRGRKPGVFDKPYVDITQFKKI